MGIGNANQGGEYERVLFAALRALAVDRVTAEVISALRGCGIETILLKGPSIARWLYPAGGRVYTDTDILVPAGEISRAQKALASLGFAYAFEGFNPIERGINPIEYQFIRQGMGWYMEVEKVDLHRNLPDLPVSDRALWEEFLAHSEIMRIGGVQVRVLARPALALHIVLHALQHGFGFHTDEDLRRVIGEMPSDDWRPVVSLAARLGVEDALGVALRRHPDGETVADRLGLPLTSPRYCVSETLRIPASLLALRAASDTSAKLRWLRWRVLPSPAKIRYVMQCPNAARHTVACGYVRWWWQLIPAALRLPWFLVNSRRTVRGTAGRPA